MIPRNTLTATDNASFLLCDDDYDEYKDNAEFIEVTMACREFGIWCPSIRGRN